MLTEGSGGESESQACQKLKSPIGSWDTAENRWLLYWAMEITRNENLVKRIL